ncbi:MAG: NAD(P)/FAD-dependent oxidoreductase [Opitutales bacterium]
MDTPKEERIQIVGGGVAGLALGVGLQKHGIPATVYDKGVYPRHRVCGEFVCGAREDTLAKLGLDQLFSKALRHRTSVWTLGGREVLRTDLPFDALGLSRYSMDLAMADEFRRNGGILHPQTDFQPDTDKQTEGVVWANGRKRERGPWLGLKMHCRNYDLQGDLEVHLGKQAYVGVSAIEGGRVNVCGLFRKIPGMRGRGEELLYRYLDSVDLGHLKTRVLDSDPDTDSYCGVSHFSFSDKSVFWGLAKQNDSTFSLGDQWGVIPPFTGNGMSIALETASLAIDPLVTYWSGEGSWKDCVSRFQRCARKHLKTRFRVANAIQPLLLNPKTQSWVAGSARRGLLPFRSLFALTHGG